MLPGQLEPWRLAGGGSRQPQRSAVLQHGLNVGHCTEMGREDDAGKLHYILLDEVRAVRKSCAVTITPNLGGKGTEGQP